MWVCYSFDAAISNSSSDVIDMLSRMEIKWSATTVNLAVQAWLSRLIDLIVTIQSSLNSVLT